MCSAAFPGHSTFDDTTVLIFDLDGTILSVNSFQHWVLHLARGSFGLNPATRGLVAWQAVTAMMLRKVLKHDHPTTKRRLQRIWSDAIARESMPTAETALVETLLRKVRPNLAMVLDRVGMADRPAILATAAVADYATALGKSLGFTHILSTPQHAEDAWRENLGTVKRDRVLGYLGAHGWLSSRRIFFTDHYDDLPLIKAADLVLWFGSDEGLEAVRRDTHGIPIENCREMDDGAVYALAFAEDAGISTGPSILRGEP